VNGSGIACGIAKPHVVGLKHSSLDLVLKHMVYFEFIEPQSSHFDSLPGDH
jgi:hypothetical protein